MNREFEIINLKKIILQGVLHPLRLETPHCYPFQISGKHSVFTVVNEYSIEGEKYQWI
jgi:hypothetical protein